MDRAFGRFSGVLCLVVSSHLVHCSLTRSFSLIGSLQIVVVSTRNTLFAVRTHIAYRPIPHGVKLKEPTISKFIIISSGSSTLGEKLSGE